LEGIETAPATNGSNIAPPAESSAKAAEEQVPSDILAYLKEMGL
jgi:hypothetical protein